MPTAMASSPRSADRPWPGSRAWRAWRWLAAALMPVCLLKPARLLIPASLLKPACLLMHLCLLMAALQATARSRVLSGQVKSLQVVVGDDWLSPPVMRLGSDDALSVSFDELSHTFHRYAYRLEHCEADWSPSQQLFESDWLEGFNDNVIDDCQNSVNTTVAYTHYALTIPNDRCRLKMSGNYRLHIYDEDAPEAGDVLVAEFRVAEQSMAVALTVSSNTDIDTHLQHQQASVSLSYGQCQVTHPEEQILLVVTQNGRDDCQRQGVPHDFVNANGLEWTHNRRLIFDGGNEYHKYEILDPSHPTMGIEHTRWNGTRFEASPYVSRPRPNYLYDEDADGAFFIRNSDNWQIETTSDYVWVCYRLQAPRMDDGQGRILIDGAWTTDSSSPDAYAMTYDEPSGLYTARILQKLGYYSYQYLWQLPDGSTRPLPSEGNFHQTENRYQAYVYYRPVGGRTWRLTAYRQLIFQ